MAVARPLGLDASSSSEGNEPASWNSKDGKGLRPTAGGLHPRISALVFSEDADETSIIRPRHSGPPSPAVDPDDWMGMRINAGFMLGAQRPPWPADPER